MKRKFFILSLLMCLIGSGFGQEVRNEVTIQGSGFLTKETTALGLTHQPTNSAGFLAGYRYNVNRWLGVEGDYDYFSNSQKYSGTSSGQVRTNVNAITGVAVIKIPLSSIFKPFAVAGGGAIVFGPRDESSLDTQSQGHLCMAAERI